MTKAFSYLRVSGLNQVDGDGFPRQREAIAKYATASGIKIVREFTEEGVSGTKETLDRPALTDLIAAVMSNGVRLVVVEKADRLARDLIIGELILKELTKLGVKVVDCSGNDLSVADGDPTKKLIRQVLSAVSEYEKVSLVLKLRSARNRLKRKGQRMEGRKPFGCDPSRPEELPTVKRIKGLKEAGTSLRKIAEELNDAKIPTREGKSWAGQTVANVLKFNP